MMQLWLSEGWILLADVTNSTHFFWELAEAGRQKRDAFFKTSSMYSGNMEGIFNMMTNTIIPQHRLEARLGNTMGDSFIIVGRYGHGDAHIREDAAKILLLAKEVKNQCDGLLDHARKCVEEVLQHYGVHRELPELKIKVTLHHGYLVTISKNQRFFGDTVNYCARIASAAFSDWNEGIVLTKKFLQVLPESVHGSVKKLRHDVSIRYPKKEEANHQVYRIGLSESAIWAEVEQLVKPVPSN